MSFQRSTESIIKQLCSGILSGGIIGKLISKGHYVLAYVAFTSIGLIDIAYHLNYLKAHITHLTYDQLTSRRDIRSRFNNFQRSVQRELLDPNDDLNREVTWLWNDMKRHIDGHIYFGMGFTMACLASAVLF
ncbi:unnamed protein product [Rotaria magnacalcarata]|uniref:Uncharacterized protein n=1 Tax=Rotaria magnacalcarata TaxID=392030 RepID=A0A814IWL6_9BILA|nr:unnamed protein product [Rotaria magnacalcarata]CAF1368037.1 unnamed protein product [Rotaria magnacalcarata]CAF1926973.1 unnamed protein product [Rotaria magnacalcarata]CAF1947232.1 unnamed protein product [Rotaria magnacalcarata]CAF2105849.1 unnamed protein product [Rotaria magnacalcarata]